MPENIIESALSGELECDLLFKWLNDEPIEAPEDCILYCSNRNEFVAYFLSYLREQTDSILQTNTNTLPIPLQGTPEKSQRKHHRSISDPTCDNDKSNDSICAKSERKTQESPNRDRKKAGRRVKTKLFSDDKTKDNYSSDESRLSIGIDRLVLSSTPMKNGLQDQNSPASPLTPQSRSFKEYERCDTPRVSRHSRSQDKNVSLGDYLVNIQPKSTKKKRSKNTSNDDSDPKLDLDLSNSEMFPEIGARKSSSLKSDRRRIKPTNIDTNKKSYSLNSFTSENFQQMSPLALEENLAFKPKLQPRECSNSFDAERNLLKQERHKLMEKFNVLNTTSTPKVTAPQFKILQKEEKAITYVEADTSKLEFKGKIDLLVDIYDVLLKNNLILSINTEIYFLITILLSKQTDEDYKIVESVLADNILKNIHNSTYFAVKSLWNLRAILEVILDKGSLKILGENKKVRSFFPDLAKFLLNSYGLKCEAESQDRSKAVTRSRCSNGIICFNQETDNAENFPSILSFQNFKKQRDMFYEILRWYREQAGSSGAGLRARVRSLLGAGPGAANHKHLAALLARLLLDAPHQRESKLNKLRMRLTRPSGDTQRHPHFTDEEMFYKDFIMCADNECFRVHLKHALATEIIALDAACIGEASNGSDVSKEFLQLSKKLGLLAKFLGYLTSLPYSQKPIDLLLKTGAVNLNSQNEEIFTIPKEKVLENNIALRNYSQPAIDIQGILLNATDNRRLAITVPWIIQYLSLLDYTTLRLKYYQKLLKILYDIYKKINFTTHKKNTVIYLKLNLGWLFDLPHFPQEVLYSKSELSVSVSDSDFDIEESVLQELCPYLKDLSVLLSTSRVNQDSNQVGSFRHITPVSLSLNNEDRIRNKEKELQLRLEEELIKSQPSSTRRVLELVTERVTSAAVKELTSTTLVEARKKARLGAASLVAGWKEQDRSGLLASLRAHYSSQLSSLRACALRSSRALACSRGAAALGALLPTAPPPLRAVAVAACDRRLTRWLDQHWADTDILCKDIEGEMHNLESVGVGVTSSSDAIDLVTCDLDALESPAQAIMDLKEQICVCLEGGPCSVSVLRACASACARRNVFCRAPALTALLHLSVDYCVVYVSRQSSKVLEILPELNAIWDQCCPNRRQDVEQTEPGSDDERAERGPEPQKCEDALSYFDRILCPRNIMLLSDSKCSGEVWSALAEVLVFLLKQHYLSEDSLTEQCLAVYKQDWPQNILENLSTCMRSVSSRWPSAGKFTLFLDFLADFCNDMDYDLIE